MFVLRSNKDKEVFFTGRWYYCKEESESELRYSYLRSYRETYPSDTLFLEIEYEEDRLDMYIEGGTTGYLWCRKTLPDKKSYKTVKIKEFVPDYSMIEINECHGEQ